MRWAKRFMMAGAGRTGPATVGVAEICCQPVTLAVPWQRARRMVGSRSYGGTWSELTKAGWKERFAGKAIAHADDPACQAINQHVGSHVGTRPDGFESSSKERSGPLKKRPSHTVCRRHSFACAQ